MRRSRKGIRQTTPLRSFSKAWEIPLPEGVSFFDEEGHERTNTRIRWWDDAATTYIAPALVDPRTTALLLDIEIGPENRLTYDHRVSVLFDHCWLQGELILADWCRLCLDYSVAKGGHLAAYQWNGETELDPTKIVYVS